MSEHTTLIFVSIAFTILLWIGIILTFLWVRSKDKELYPEKYYKWLK